VRFPGSYPLVRNMTLNQAIRFAGGLDASAELEHILVERRSDNRGSIEVLSTSINPDTLRNATPIVLQEEDEILGFNANQPREGLLEDTLAQLRAQASITRPTQIVSITDQVRFPGDYPLVPGLSVEQLISMAGGLLESADITSAEITRFDAEPGTGRVIGIVNLDLRSSSATDGQNYTLSPFDRLVVRQMPNWTEFESVTIGGEVNLPGTYAISKDESISSLIARAGGLTQYADPRAAIFLREELRLNEQRMLDEFRDRLQRDIINRNLQSSEDNIAGSEVAQLLALVEEVDATGRLVIDLPTVLAHTGQNSSRAQQADVILRNGDQLLIPRTQQEISVIGEVNRATSHLFQRNNNVSDYIGLSGGYTRSADQNNVFIIKASGEVVAFGNSRWFFQQGARLEPGDTIIVPYDARQTNYLRVWTSVSQILFNISTTLLAIERVGN
jgi:protein involved in polysaccharide export with SLBB domain